MSKHNNKSTPTTPTTPTTSEPSMSPTPPEAAPETTLATTGDAAVVVPAPGENLGYLAHDLPHLKDKLIKLVRPTPLDLEQATAGFTPEERGYFDSIMSRLSSDDSEVMGEGTDDTFTNKIRMVKLFQGGGDDTSRPDECPIGGFYVRQGGTLAVLPDDAARLEMPSFFRAAVIGFYNGATYWAPKDKAGNLLLPEGVPPDLKGPICSSLDRDMGFWYGRCKQCPFRQTQGQEKACSNEVTLFLMTEDFQVYRATISSTSTPTCVTPIRAQIENWTAAHGLAYERYFSFSSEKKTRGEQRWFIWKAAVAKNKTHPQGVPTSEGFRKLASYFARLIRTEWYYPSLASTYARAATNAVERGATKPNNSDALAALNASKPETEDHRNNI